MMTERQIQERINKLKEELEVLQKVLDTPAEKKMGRPVGSTKYSNEQTEFLKKNKDLPMKELVGLYNKEFGTNLPLDTRLIYNYMVRQEIIKQNFKKEYFPRKPETTYKGIITKRKKLKNDRLGRDKPEQ